MLAVDVIHVAVFAETIIYYAFGDGRFVAVFIAFYEFPRMRRETRVSVFMPQVSFIFFFGVDKIALDK